MIELTNLFNKIYFERCKEEFGNMGFVKDRNSFVRIVNKEIVQSFCLQKWGGGYKCEIHFGIEPLCGGEKPGFPSLRYSLRKFIYTIQDPWVCKGKDQEIIDGVENVILDIKQYIIPSFERAIDTASALNETIYLDKLVYKIVSLRNGENVISSTELDEKAVRMNDNAKYFLALKSENYKFAAKCLEAFLKEQLYIYERCKDCCEEFEGYPKENVLNCEKEISLLEKEIVLIKNGEYDYFRKIVKENEKNNEKLYQKIKNIFI